MVQEGGYFDGKLKMKDRSGASRSASAQRTANGATPEDEQTPAQV